MFLDAIVKNEPKGLKEIKHMFHDLDHASHMNHCFDYLRQTIACGGDMSMEWPRTEPDGRRFAVDGWGIPHECKSWVSRLLSDMLPSQAILNAASSLIFKATWTNIILNIRGTPKLLH
jgi:hypothetical protein